MTDHSQKKEGLSFIEATAGAIILLAISLGLVYSVLTEGFTGIPNNSGWWGYLFFWGVVAVSFVKGGKCFYSTVLQIKKVSSEERYWQEQHAEQVIWKVLGSVIGFGVIGLFILVSWENSSSSGKPVTLGEAIIITLLLAILYNQRKK